MRRLATLCIPALLSPSPRPLLASNDGVIVFVPPQPQAAHRSPRQRPCPPASVPAPAPARGRYGGGLIEALLTGGPRSSRRRPPTMRASPRRRRKPSPSRSSAARKSTIRDRRPPAPFVIDTPDRFLFLVEPNGKALRYGIGVGRPGFEWSGVKRISRKSEWPDWTPPHEMLLRRPDLPRRMAGGPDNPLGARALYLGSSLYRIHGTNEPSTIGHNVSSGCIRMMNEDVIDLYERVPVGTKVIVL